MYKVLIAEDEILVRLGLANSINWEHLGMQLTAQASNGVQAYELFLSEHPDIIITDIRMPLMDGMEFIKKIREIDSNCKIVIITCVDEFSYAKQAIAYQVEDYILKLTMNIEEIEKLLMSIKSQLDKSHTLDKTSNSTLFNENIQTRQELYECLCGYSSSVSYNNYTATFYSDKFYISFIRILLADKLLSQKNNQDKICTDKSLYQLLQQHLEHDGALLIERIPGEYFLLFHSKESFLKDFETISILTKNYYNSHPVCSISPSVKGFSTAFKAVQNAQQLLLLYFFFPEKNIFTEEIKELKIKNVKKTIFDHIKDIVLSFSSYPHINELWDEYAERIHIFLTDCNEDADDIKKLFYYLADWFQETLALTNSESTDNCVYNYRRYIFESSNILDIYFIFERFLNKLLSFTLSEKTLSREMQEIIHYIEKNYAQNLNLETLSAHVNYSKGYLCTIFRKELNTSFGSYLTKVRISHAKKLLATSFLRLYEIAEQTGFYDYSHFARTFKKYTGFSPQEYQNHQADSVREESSK